MDDRFIKVRDAVKYYIPMCKDCGMCCVALDWSTEWMGKKVGICGNLKDGECIDETKKSIICRTYVCKDMTEFIDRLAIIASRNCPTANKMMSEMVLRKQSDFSQMELLKIQEAFNGKRKIGDKNGNGK